MNIRAIPHASAAALALVSSVLIGGAVTVDVTIAEAVPTVAEGGRASSAVVPADLTVIMAAMRDRRAVRN